MAGLFKANVLLPESGRPYESTGLQGKRIGDWRVGTQENGRREVGKGKRGRRGKRGRGAGVSEAENLSYPRLSPPRYILNISK